MNVILEIISAVLLFLLWQFLILLVFDLLLKSAILIDQHHDTVHLELKKVNKRNQICNWHKQMRGHKNLYNFSIHEPNKN